MSKIILKNVRCSYVFIKEPRKGEEGEVGKYSLQVLLPKDDPQVKKVKQAIKEAAEEKFGAKVKIGMLKVPLRDGDEERDDDSYAGNYFFNANSARKPGIVNNKAEPADQDDLEDYCYSGAFFNVSINFYGFDFKGKKGVAAGLNNVMLWRKGDRLDGSTSATNEFAEFADADDDDGFGDEDDIPF